MNLDVYIVGNIYFGFSPIGIGSAYNPGYGPVAGLFHDEVYPNKSHIHIGSLILVIRTN